MAGATIHGAKDAEGLQRLVVDANSATLDQLRGYHDEVFGQITVAARHWAQVRLLVGPARLLGATKHTVLLLTESSNRGSRAHDVGSLTNVQRLRWVPEAGGQLRIELKSRVPLTLADVLRALVGPDPGASRVPVRVALADRTVERFAVGNPHSRYVGADDVTMTAGDLAVTNADLIIAGTDVPEHCGLDGEGDERGRPVLRALSPGGRFGAADLGVDPALVLPPVDTWSVSPSGHRWGALERTAHVAPAGDGTWRVRDDADADLAQLAAGEPLSRGDLAALRNVRFLDCQEFRPDDPVAHASTLAQLTCAGVPVLAGSLPAAVTALLGAPLCEALAAVTPEHLADPLAREAISVRSRRTALHAHGHGARARRLAELAGLRLPTPPSISVLFMTKRPTFLRLALSQIARQTWPSVEVVLGLHGDHFAEGDLEEATSVLPAAPTVVRIPGTTRYGDALNIAAEACTGNFIAKWDDDDLYGAEHLSDLMLAAEYSGATLVGKGPEFILLDEMGIIVRPGGHRGERYTSWIAGGTLLFRRQTLADLGGWRPVGFSVDQSFIRQILDVGGTVYRTHGLGYILRRHSHGHTWDPGLDHFLRQPNEQWDASPALQQLILECDLP